MSHQDSKVQNVRLDGKCLKQALSWLLRDIPWSGVCFRADCSWTPMLLAAAALVWVWSDEATLVERFQTARSIIAHLFQVQHQLAGSYQAFMKMLCRWTPVLVPLIQDALRQRMQRLLPEYWQIYGFAVFGVDGSRAELPRTQSHERAYSAARPDGKSQKRRRRKNHRRQKSTRAAGHAKKANSPQMWLTLMWHVGTGLVWDWRTGPADSSERAHMLEMLPSLPPQALIAADAGFVGYDYLKAIMDSGRHLLIRVGANVRLLRKLGYTRESDATVYLWPDRSARQQCPPLVLRLVVSHNGKHPVYLVTSVVSTNRLSDRQVIDLYSRRWGIEVYYRHLKQTFARRKLRSTSADNAQVEMQWSLVGLWAMGVYALIEAHRNGIPPSRVSFAGLLRAVRRTLRDYRHPSQPGCHLRHRLREAIIDDYVRKNKSSRGYPRKKQEQPPGQPIINNATRSQVKSAQAIATTGAKTTDKRLPA